MSFNLPFLFITTLFLVLLAVASAEYLGFNTGRKEQWCPRFRHCYVTGGSSGLGLALAILLTKSGADVSIVARNKERLDTALNQLEDARQTPNQLLYSYSYDISDEAEAKKALLEACKPHEGRSPDAVFLCAGKSTPGFFLQQDGASLRKGMDDSYWVSVWTALAAAKHMVSNKFHGKIIFVSSILGYMSIVGYSSYSPAKWALRGFAETLRSEFILYGIDVHIFFPPSIYSPGYDEENKTKPDITLKIEETDEGLTPEQAAAGLLRGVQNGDFHITTDILGNIFRASTRGATPNNSYVLDIFYGLIGWVGIPIWRRSVDSQVRKHASVHREFIETQEAWQFTDPKDGAES